MAINVFTRNLIEIVSSRKWLARMQIAAGEASHLLDMVASGEGLSWDDIRSDLAAQYEKAGVQTSAALVKSL